MVRIGYPLCIGLVMGLPAQQLLAAETDALLASEGPVPVTTAPLGQEPRSRAARTPQAPPQPVVMSFEAFKALLAEEEEEAELVAEAELAAAEIAAAEAEAAEAAAAELAAAELAAAEAAAEAEAEAAELAAAELAAAEAAAAELAAAELAAAEAAAAEAAAAEAAAAELAAAELAAAELAAAEAEAAELAAAETAAAELAAAELAAAEIAAAEIAAAEIAAAEIAAAEAAAAELAAAELAAAEAEAAAAEVAAAEAAAVEAAAAEAAAEAPLSSQPEELAAYTSGVNDSRSDSEFDILPPPLLDDTVTFPGSRRPLPIAVGMPPGGVLDLNTAVVQAVASHPSIARSFGQLYETLEMVDVAKAGYYPTVSTTIGSNYRRDSSNVRETFSISASQMLWDFGKVSSSVDAAGFSADRNRAGVLQSIDDLSRNTAHAFVEVQRGRALLDIARRQTAAVAEIEELALARSDLGASTRSDTLQAQSRREAAAALELQLQAELDLWKRTLQNFIGYEVPALVSEGFPAVLDQACMRVPANFDDAPQVLAANAELAEARTRINQAKANMYPTLSLNANYGNLNNPVNTSFDFANQRDLTFTLNVSSTLFQGGASMARRRAAEYAVQASEAARAAAVLEVSRSYREAHDQTRSLNARLAALSDRYDSIVDTQALYRQQYLSLGTRTLLDILNTEQEIHQSLFDQVHTEHDLRRLQVVCLHSVGGLRDALLPDSRKALEGGMFHE